MNLSNMSRNRAQVYSVGNYLMTGKVLGKGHFARVEEATHRIIGKKVAIKIIDLTSIKEEYARRNLHREPRVMSKLRHPCIAALYETMMHGPRLYVVMEAACGGDLCTHVASRGRGLPEQRARPLAAQLLSATRHMHARGVVHRDLKMENIMLDATKQFIKIVDFGLSNVWSAGGALRTPCGSLEYAAPELFVDGRRYGPEVDLWSIGVIVYGMVTGGLPFSGADAGSGAGGAGGAEARSRPLLRAAIARGFCRKQRAALACVSNECKVFIQHLLEPNVALRMKIEEAARHRWIRRPGMRMKTHPFGPVEPKINREIYRQISELNGQPVMDVVAQITAEPFGATAGIYNIKTHLHQLQASPGTDLLWSSAQDIAPSPAPEYRESYECVTTPSSSKTVKLPPNPTPKVRSILDKPKYVPPKISQMVEQNIAKDKQSPRCTINRPFSSLGLKKPVYKVYDNGDGLDPRLPCIDEHSSTNVEEVRCKNKAKPYVRKASMDPPRLNSCPDRFVDRRSDFYRRAGDALPNWRAHGNSNTTPTRVLYQNNATTIKRASLGNIVSPHSSTNSQCKSERSMPVTWFSTRSSSIKEGSHIQRLRRTAPMK